MPVRFGTTISAAAERRVVSFQADTYVVSVQDGGAGTEHGMLENLADVTENGAAITAGIVTLNGFSSGLKQAIVQAHWPLLNAESPRAGLVLVILNAADAAAAYDLFTAAIATGSDTGVGNADVGTNRIGGTDIGYDIISPTFPQVYFDLRDTDTEIERIHLLAVDTPASITAADNGELVVTARAW